LSRNWVSRLSPTQTYKNSNWTSRRYLMIIKFF
jgi:hypothetical protein